MSELCEDMWSTLLYSTLTCPNARALQRHIVYTPRRTFSPQRAGYLYLLDPSRHTAHSSFLSFNHCFPNKTKISNSEKNKTRERRLFRSQSGVFSRYASISLLFPLRDDFFLFLHSETHTYIHTHVNARVHTQLIGQSFPSSSSFDDSCELEF